VNRDRFARKLIESPHAERIKLLARHRASCDAELAKSLQNLCYEVWTNEPQKVSEIAATLDLIAEFAADSDEIKAFAEWTRAIEYLVKGELKKCVKQLDASEKSFVLLGKTHNAATTQISKLYALALLGRYDEAVACGLRAREIFLDHNDIYSVGKIEHNIGNLYWRRDFYRESEPFLTSAHERFSQINDVRQLAMVENCQAFVKALQNDFRAAETIYESALTRAKSDSLIVTEAEIEIGLSNLFLFQGKFDRALSYLESSRRKYETLAMPQPTANCELEIADIYLEINFLTEAAELYESVAAKFTALGMQAELARCLLNYSRALFALNETEKLDESLEHAENLFNAEGNNIANAAVYLLKAQIHLRKNDLNEAKSHAEKALRISLDGANPRYELSARWLLGEIYSSENNLDESRRILEQTLEAARKNLSPIEYFCLVSLGKIAFRQNDLNSAETLFRQAIDLTENSRTTLAAEEFRAAFAADKLLPYQKLVEIKLREKDLHAAFEWLERSRSRTLYEAMSEEDFASDLSPDSAEAALYAEQKSLREELNWFYSRLNRGKSSGLEAQKKKADLRRAALTREKKLAEISRRITTNGDFNLGKYQTANVEELQKNLNGATLIEFFASENQISAFVVTSENFIVHENIADLSEVESEIKRFLFQIKTGRFIEKLDAVSRKIAESRLRAHARKLYDLLLKPLELKTPRLAFVPFGQLHYLPFQSLHDGETFLVERYEITTAPSANILQAALNKKPVNTESALLVGVADKYNPAVKTEIERLGGLFPNAVRLIDKTATLGNISKNCAAAGVVHLACHGKFRPDNPMFSALELYRENLTVRDIRRLNLNGKLVVLSACETGLNRIESGEELFGLTRGFLSAGANSLVMSLWTVDDDSTLFTMSEFYANLQAGENSAKALRRAQIELLQKKTHPYFWSAFFVCGQF
jgi:CHAT domain-containing protein/tetratricopeptide (TPR) repeat protein